MKPLLSLLILSLVASPLYAGEHNHQQRFQKADTDGDGLLSKSEMRAVHEKRFDKMFNRLDADGDTKISADEMKAGKRKMRERMKNRRIEQSK